MSIFSRIMGFFNDDETSNQPKLAFGRFSDSEKSLKEEEFWELSLQNFNASKYHDSIEYFLNYLKNPHQDNSKYKRAEESIYFEFFQGSKRITGSVDSKQLKASSVVAKVNSLNVGFLRRVLEYNHKLNYSKFSIDQDNQIVIEFTSLIQDTSPYKLFYGFKELAIQADRNDDTLIDEFDDLQEIDSGHIIPILDEHKEVKIKFLRSWLYDISMYIEEISKQHDDIDYAISVLLLDYVYKVDYLLRPQGFMMDKFESINSYYYTNSAKSIIEKNKFIMESINEISSRPDDILFKELYNTVSTFGIVNPITIDSVFTNLDEQLSSTIWYNEKQLFKVSEKLPSLVIGQLLFSHALPSYLRRIFHLYYIISNHAFFHDLGYSYNYVDHQNSKLDASSIESKLKFILSSSKKSYPKLMFDTKMINYDSISSFGYTLLYMCKSINQ